MSGSPTLSRRSLLRLAGLGATGAALGAATGCGGQSVTNGSSSQLEFMYWGSTFEQKAVATMLGRFAKDTKNVSVKPLYTPGSASDYDTKMNALVASNRPPSVAYMNTALAFRLAEGGKLVNLVDYFDKYPSLKERLPNTYFWYGKDKLLGCATAPEIFMLWFNKKVFADAGVDLPPAQASQAWTWDHFVEQAYRLTFDQNGHRPDEPGFDPKQIRQFGASVGGVQVNPMQALLASNHTAMFNDDCTRCLLDTPDVIKVFQDVADLSYKHHVAPTATQLGNNAPTTTVQLQTKRIAMAMDGQWILLDLGQSGLSYGCGVLPKYKESTTVSVTAISSVFSGVQDRDAAMELFMYHNDPAKVDLFADGLWMPLEKKYYTDPAAIDSWTKNSVHPAEYRTAAVDYAANHAVRDFNHYLKNQTAIDNLLTPAFQLINQGTKSAAEVLKPLAAKINPLLQGRYPAEQL